MGRRGGPPPPGCTRPPIRILGFARQAGLCSCGARAAAVPTPRQPRLPRARRGRASRGPLPPPPPRSFSVSAEAAILLLPRAGVGGPSPLQVRPPAGPPPHGLRPLRTVSPRPPLPTPAVRSGCHFRRGAASGGGGGRPGLSVTGGAAGGRHLREGPQHHRPLWRSRAPGSGLADPVPGG